MNVLFVIIIFSYVAVGGFILHLVLHNLAIASYVR